MEPTFNFDLDDTARRIGHLVLRIWQLEEENKRAFSSTGLRGQAAGHAPRESGEGIAAAAVEAVVAHDQPGNGADRTLQSAGRNRDRSSRSFKEGLE